MDGFGCRLGVDAVEQQPISPTNYSLIHRHANRARGKRVFIQAR